MKKYGLGLAMMAGLVFASVTMAAPLSSANFVTSKMSAAAAKSQAGLSPTDVIVLNTSPAPIYFSVPGTRIDDFLLLSGEASYVREFSRAFSMTVNIEDSRHNMFWTRFVCPRAVIVVAAQRVDGVALLDEHC
jgi:hypothetical protein